MPLQIGAYEFIGEGACGRVYRAPSCGLIMKVAEGEQVEELENEYAIYQHLHKNKVHGIPGVFGLFEGAFFYHLILQDVGECIDGLESIKYDPILRYVAKMVV
jgi:hypothetical protein